MARLGVKEIHQALKEAGGENWSSFNADVSRLLLGVLQLLAGGNPVPVQRLEKLAEELGIGPAAGDQIANRMSERNEAGDIVGAFGLSLNKHPHSFRLEDRTLSTWCAWDALFLPSLIGIPAEVTSTDPESGQQVELTVTPTGVTSSRPDDATFTIVIPPVLDSEGPDSVSDVWTVFCQQVHFFASRDSAVRWAAKRDHDIHVLTAEEGFELGQLQFARLLRYARDSTAASKAA